MPFPESGREIYRRNPLKQVICQLRFPTILQVRAETPAEFQNSIRDQYPLYAEEAPMAGLPKEVSDVLVGLPLPKGLGQSVHKFLTEDGSRFVSLSKDFLAVTERNYERWEYFREEVKRVEEAFRGVYKPAFYSRIGLRYRDEIDREALELSDRNWRELLRDSFIGILGEPTLADEVEDIRTQLMLRLSEVPNGYVRMSHGLARTQERPHTVYVIDTDLFVEGRSSEGDVFEVLDTFSRLAGRLFRWVIHDPLRNALQPDAI